MALDGIIFDLDGTLWDSRKAVADSWTKVVQDRHDARREVTAEELTGLMGLQLPEIGDRLFPELDPDERKELMDECCVYENDYVAEKGGVLYPGVEEVLKQLSQTYPLYIVSNCQDGYIEAFFEAHGLGSYFKDYENPGRTGLPKSGNIKLVMERNNLENAVYVGDTKGDEDAARGAGVPFIWAAYGFGKPENPDYRIGALAELPGLVEKL
ncbi:HAD family hydrolase [Bhargavaea cecembensis]|uniref:HAD family hydrolase n=1 Tax=Bhargavaea cecembensis TaxID=394098 RepID=A0A161SLU0_9BACL|nr:HAD family hydrolase [Bhargavaea cecembensis]KZE38703.1 HAD family hydrolase [Bhargavaea cecembensis]